MYLLFCKIKVFLGIFKIMLKIFENKFKKGMIQIIIIVMLYCRNDVMIFLKIDLRMKNVKEK